MARKNNNILKLWGSYFLAIKVPLILLYILLVQKDGLIDWHYTTICHVSNCLTAPTIPFFLLIIICSFILGGLVHIVVRWLDNHYG